MSRNPNGWLGSRLSLAWFQFRAAVLCTLRAGRNLGQALGPGQPGASDSAAWQAVLGKSSSTLWTARTPEEAVLVAGKVHNVRLAAARINGLQLNAGDTFSFWHAVGRPSRSAGYVPGRELREGCMIASIGGGLCQLSNALYAAALEAGMEMVERHPHSQIVPGSQAAGGRDATVFWNYIDLRFRTKVPFVIDAHLTADDLVLRLRAREPGAPVKTLPAIIPVLGQAPADCARCDQTDCVERIDSLPVHDTTAYLLDAVWPEFDAWIGTRARPGDMAIVPLDGSRRSLPTYAWPSLSRAGVRVRERTWLTLRRSLAMRMHQHQGARRQAMLLAYDQAFARSDAGAIDWQARDVVVAINLLPALWQRGALGGRRFTVLFTRAPMAMLQAELDLAVTCHPESPTLSDFRADPALVAAEEAALHAAAQLVTPHQHVADFLAAHYSAKIVRLAWRLPPAKQAHVRGNIVLFPASALGRKGAYAVREACRKLGLPLRVLGTASDSPNFWNGLNMDGPGAGNLFDGIGCVVLPAYVEHRPALLLRALAAGLPVICSPECGISPDTANLTLIPAGDSSALAAALSARMST